MARQLYKVRSSVHEPLGSFTKKQIIERIKSGKYKGEEEVSAPPYTRWHKLSSHPVFYDAFLKKIFHGDYQSPSPEEPSVSGVSRKGTENAERRADAATRQGDAKTRAAARAAAKEEREEVGAKTRQLGEERIAGGTVQQSVIDELFSDGRGAAEEEQEFPGDRASGPERGTDLIRIEVPLAEPTLKSDIPLPKALDIAEDVREEESPEAVAKKNALRRSQNIRKSIWIGSAVVLALVFLFQMGKPSETDSISAAQKQGYSLRPRVHAEMEEGARHDEKVKALLDEADLLYAGDTRLSYLAALEIYRDALGYEESNSQILGRVAMTGARLLPDAPDPDGLVREIRRTIESGRVKEPQFAVFFRVEALVALYQKKAEDAKRLIMNALEADPNSGENALVAGEVHYYMGDREAARQAFEESVKALPGSARSHYSLARTAFDMRDQDRARAEGIEALKINPLHPPTYLLLGDIAVEQNQPKDARGLYETCGRLAKFTTKETTAKAYFRLGSIYEAAGNTASAQNSFRLAYYYYPEVDSSLATKVKGLDLAPASLAKIADEAEYGKGLFPRARRRSSQTRQDQ